MIRANPFKQVFRAKSPSPGPWNAIDLELLSDIPAFLLNIPSSRRHTLQGPTLMEGLDFEAAAQIVNFGDMRLQSSSSSSSLNHAVSAVLDAESMSRFIY